MGLLHTRLVKGVHLMNIGNAAKLSGLSTKTIRYYEDIGLMVPMRNLNGYRNYSTDDVHKLRFLHRTRHLGFSIEHCRMLLALYEDRELPNTEVKRLAESHLKNLDHKRSQLNSLQDLLTRLVQSCQAGIRPACPILDELPEEQELRSA